MIPFFITHVSREATARVAETLNSGLLSEGTLVRRFELELQNKLGLSGAVALNSGTSALHLGLICGGIGPGDEVILPAQTFIASGLSILQAGARPVFADIDPATGNLDPASVRRFFTARTKAVMPVHWGGMPCDLDELASVASDHGAWLIEDAAHAIGATYKKRFIGAISRFTVFSFQAIKHITTGDGGMLVCRLPEDEAVARRRRWFDIERENSPMSPEGERQYDAQAVGYKYHLNDYAAALGLANLPDLPEILSRRRMIASRYREELAGVQGVTLLDAPLHSESAWWLFTMRVERRLDFIVALRERGVPASVVHQGIHKNTVFGQIGKDLPGQRLFDETQVSIPVHEQLLDDDVTLIIDSIRRGW